MRHDIAVNLFKDFTTNCYQVTIGCNANIVMKDSNEKTHYINAIKLLYDCPYPSVVLDAEQILTQYDETKQFSLENMRCCDKRIIESVPLQLTEDEQNRSIVVRDGKTYLILGTEKAFLHTVGYDEGWTPPSKK